jgi:hypothetical protein
MAKEKNRQYNDWREEEEQTIQCLKRRRTDKTMAKEKKKTDNTMAKEKKNRQYNG